MQPVLAAIVRLAKTAEPSVNEAAFWLGQALWPATRASYIHLGTVATELFGVKCRGEFGRQTIQRVVLRLLFEIFSC